MKDILFTLENFFISRIYFKENKNLAIQTSILNLSYQMNILKTSNMDRSKYLIQIYSNLGVNDINNFMNVD